MGDYYINIQIRNILQRLRKLLLFLIVLINLKNCYAISHDFNREIDANVLMYNYTIY